MFGNIAVIKNNFGLVTIGIIAISLLPMLWALLSERTVRDRSVGPS